MAASNINRVVLTGNLTKDPELRALPSGTHVCELRIGVNSRRKNQSTGEWDDKPNFFNVKVFGGHGENCSRYLAKGRPVAIDGRLEWREWQAQDTSKRQAVDIIAESVQFLGSSATPSDGAGVVEFIEETTTIPDQVPVGVGVGVGVGAETDASNDESEDIPF